MRFSKRNILLLGTFIMSLCIGLFVLGSNSGQFYTFRNKILYAFGNDKAFPSVIADYPVITRKEILANSSRIFVGRILQITPARWNKDDNEPITIQQWETGRLSGYHQVIAVVDIPLIGVNPGQAIAVTVGGNSPIGIAPQLLNPKGSSYPNGSVFGRPIHDFKVGQSGVFLLKDYQMPWIKKTGEISQRRAISFMGGPPEAGFLVERNGAYVSNLPWDLPYTYTLATLRSEIESVGRKLVR